MAGRASSHGSQASRGFHAARAGADLPRPGGSAPRLLDQLREAIRVRHYSRETEKAYVGWIRRFVLFHGKRHPRDMGEAEVSRFLAHLATRRKLSASTQNQALSALLFLYREILRRELPEVGGAARARRPVRLPVVLSRLEVRSLLGQLHGVPRLMASLLYGSGMRLLECCRLRVKDVDFERREIMIRDGKGRKDRGAPLPAILVASLAAHLERVRAIHVEDSARGLGAVELPGALALNSTEEAAVRHSRGARLAALGLLIVVAWSRSAVATPPVPLPFGHVPYVYACGQWFPHDPPEARGLFDVYWLGERIKPEDRQALDGLQADVVHEFNVRAVRARLWLAKIPRGPGIRIESVEQPHDYTVKVRIRMPPPRLAGDREFLDGLGAEIIADYGYDMLVRVQDATIPAIRAYPRVEYVVAAGQQGCLD